MESPRGINDPSLGAFAEMLARTDCVLLLGKRLDFTLAFAKAPAFDPDCVFVQIDPDAAEPARTKRAVADRLAAAAVADVAAAIETLIARTRQRIAPR
jgi:acetolactate synthase-1/2/3 large subunit